MVDLVRSRQGEYEMFRPYRECVQVLNKQRRKMKGQLAQPASLGNWLVSMCIGMCAFGYEDV